MLKIALPQDQYTFENALKWGNFRGHAKKSCSGSFGNRVVHVLIASIEFFPIISQIASLFEMFLASFISHDKSLNVREITSISVGEVEKDLSKNDSSIGSFNPVSSQTTHSKEPTSKTDHSDTINPEHEQSDRDCEMNAYELLEEGKIEEVLLQVTKIKVRNFLSLYAKLTMKLLEINKENEAKTAFDMFEEAYKGRDSNNDDMCGNEYLKMVYNKTVEFEHTDLESYITHHYPEAVESVITFRRSQLEDMIQKGELENAIDIAMKHPKKPEIMNEDFISQVIQEAIKQDKIDYLIELDNNPAVPLNIKWDWWIKNAFSKPRALATILAKSNNDNLKDGVYTQLNQPLLYRPNEGDEFLNVAKEFSQYPKVYKIFMLKAGMLFLNNMLFLNSKGWNEKYENIPSLNGVLDELKKEYPETHDKLLNEVLKDINACNPKEVFHSSAKAFIPRFVSDDKRNKWKAVIETV